jgi:hypothetical protein
MTYIGLVHIGPFLREIANQLHPALIILHVPDHIQQGGEALALEGPRHHRTGTVRARYKVQYASHIKPGKRGTTAVRGMGKQHGRGRGGKAQGKG